MIEAAAQQANKGLRWYYSGIDGTSHSLMEAEIAVLAMQGKVGRTIVYEAAKEGDKGDAVGRLD
jgi:hypothetical protein